MKIRLQLTIAFLIVTLLPVVMCLLCGYSILYRSSKTLQENYNLETEDYDIWLNPYKILNKVTFSDYERLVEIADKEPDQFKNADYITQLNQQAAKRKSFLILRQNNTTLFIGDTEKYQKMPALPAFHGYEEGVSSMTHIDHINSIVVREKDFYYTDGAEGQIFIATDMSKLIPHWQKAIRKLFFSYLFIIIITAVILLAWVYRGIVYPLTILRIAARQIGSGNLDQTIPQLSKNEIGELCDDFENMRCRLKAMIDERIQHDEATRLMMGSISHDLKTPLTAIKGYTEGLIDGIAQTPAMQTKYLQTIYSKANDMAYLVDELSLFAQIEQDTMTYRFSSVNVADYFSDCMEDLELDVADFGMKLSYCNNTDPDTCIFADPEQLKRVINNISNNAIKYIDHRPSTLHVQIDTGVPDEFILVQIKDDGPGITEKDLPLIFDQFYRADTSRTSSTGGSGLGLAIVKKIIMDHGGKVWAESEEGHGTKICFLLKKSQKQEENTSHETKKGKP